MTTSGDDVGAFSRFLDLPPELRIMIWKLCLPHRIHELDKVHYAPDEGDFAFICGAQMTTHANLRPPAISRVCYESRTVALQSRVLRPHGEMLEDARWEDEGPAEITKGFIDPSRDMVHLNDSNGFPHGNEYYSAIAYLAWHAENSAQGGSLNLDNICFHCPEALSGIPNLVVITKTIVIHASARYCRKTGLFGLLGDAPIQLVDLADEERLKAFFDLAEKTQKKGHVTFAQDLQRKPSEILQQEFENFLAGRLGSPYNDQNPPPPMRPVRMFRLCTDMCNNSEDAEDGFLPPPETRFVLPSSYRGRESELSEEQTRLYRLRGCRGNKVVA
ncbi:hypothetical protein N7466_010436 [Penicillium verhagenii]|uniref:uncharacterized protein n=1 Tax=Penicillium verhagenii TaxID=1562060 RepID=UPI002545647D|nr:uncharacterized protein N7466_010436 [Penicillium verhagenii]KAJ5918444.1 hypothetical protein N7466_010436 [Penicillium verhagenii]